MPLTDSNSMQSALQLARQGGGYVTVQAAAAAGLPRNILSQLERQGKLERLERGLYRLPDERLAPVTIEATELLEVQLRYPYARPCLVSALHLHGLTTTRPTALQVAVPANRHSLTFQHYLVETFFFQTQVYREGVVRLEVRERVLLIYSVEKTLVDLLRYAPKFGRVLYLEGLKKALAGRRVNRSELARLAKASKVWKELSRDLEVLSHDQDH